MTLARRLLLVLVMLLAGCRTPSKVEPSLVTTAVPEALEIAPPAPLLPEPSPAPPGPARTNAQPGSRREEAKPVNSWVSLETWGQSHGLGLPVRQAANPQPRYEIRAPNGNLVFQVGSRLARCDGFECWLGYAPQLVRGKPYIHALDAQKSLLPLIRLAGATSRPRGTVVVDPGHGGVDSGATSVFNGRYEKDYTLDWALRLRRLLVARSWQVVLTRTNDVEISLTNRVLTAERANADVFISLHFNSGAPNRELAGIETYCLTPAGMPSHIVRTSEDDARQVFPNNTYDEGNLQFAFKLHRMLIKTTAATDRGVRRARFMGVLRGQNRPAVLVEGGYLSNSAEAGKIALPEYREKLAEAIARGLD